MTDQERPDRKTDDTDFHDYEVEYHGVKIYIKNPEDILESPGGTVLFREVYSDEPNTVLKSVTLTTEYDQRNESVFYLARIELDKGLSKLLSWNKFWEDFASQEETIINSYDDIRLCKNGLSLHDDSLPRVDLAAYQDGSLCVGVQRVNYNGPDRPALAIQNLSILAKSFIEIDEQMRDLVSMGRRQSLVIDISNENSLDSGRDRGVRDPSKLLESIHGMHSIQEDIAEIVMSHEHSEAMKEQGLAPIGSVLLEGEPGVGKTVLAHAIAERICAKVYTVKGSDVMHGIVGESAQRLKAVFDQAKSGGGKAVLILDELDGITNGTGNEGAQRGVNAELKSQLNDLSDNYPNVLVIATSNDKDKIDPAILCPGRFDKILHVQKPNEVERLEMILAEIQHIPELLVTVEAEITPEAIITGSSSISPGKLAELADGFTGADIKEVFRRARMKKAMLAIRLKDPVQVTCQDIETEIDTFYR